uniref:Uncharacterized protein n=1 Tax=Rousettus aegyptiacus TaxID=9407 RepID=A0A7J8BA43_ROUAE|nr:hypothetical protein HJG63_009890 [Rousettus aegyptiacus]
METESHEPSWDTGLEVAVPALVHLQDWWSLILVGGQDLGTLTLVPLMACSSQLRCGCRNSGPPVQAGCWTSRLLDLPAGWPDAVAHVRTSKEGLRAGEAPYDDGAAIPLGCFLAQYIVYVHCTIMFFVSDSLLNCFLLKSHIFHFLGSPGGLTPRMAAPHRVSVPPAPYSSMRGASAPQVFLSGRGPR